MQTETKLRTIRPRRLSSVILEYLFLSVLISVFTYLFLYTTSCSIAETYLLHKGLSMTESQDIVFRIWIRSICIAASILIFVVLFLFMLGPRLSYLLSIIKGIDRLQENQMDFDLPLDGQDDLTLLAESINFLSASQRELARKEQALQEERDAWIRSLSHDIRTPLTSLLSYSEIMLDKETLTASELKSYTELVHQKALQIKELTSRLMENRETVPTAVENIRFLMEQLAAEWEEILDGRFDCAVNLENCDLLNGFVDIYALRRIMDNLASNIEKYADPSSPVHLTILTEGRTLILIQTNRKKALQSVTAESHLIGLDSIRRICRLHRGDVHISEEDTSFRMRVTLEIDGESDTQDTTAASE